MNATTTATDIGNVANSVIDTAINTVLIFIGTSTLITALIIGGIAYGFIRLVSKYISAGNAAQKSASIFYRK